MSGWSTSSLLSKSNNVIDTMQYNSDLMQAVKLLRWVNIFHYVKVEIGFAAYQL